MTKKISYTLVFDTNALELYSNDNNGKNYTGNINPSVIEFLEEYSTRCNLKLVLPKIVIEENRKHFCYYRELLISRYKSAASNLKKNLDIDVENQELSNEELITLCDKQISKFKPNIIFPNYSALDWDKVLIDSVWYTLPFEGSHEKGFKDLMIIESLNNYSNVNKYEEIVFICGDEKLRCGYNLRKTTENITIFVNLSDFKNDLDLKLDDKDLTNSEIELLTNNANEIFILKLKNESIEKINNAFKNILFKEENSSVISTSYTLNQPIGDYKYRVSKPRFISKERGVYEWETSIFADQEYGNPLMFSHSNEITSKEFLIRWKAKINQSKDFNDAMPLGNIKYNGSNSHYYVSLMEPNQSLFSPKNYVYPNTGLIIESRCVRCGNPINTGSISVISNKLCDDCLSKVSPVAAFY